MSFRQHQKLAYMSGAQTGSIFRHGRGILYSGYILEDRTLEECREALQTTYPYLHLKWW